MKRTLPVLVALVLSLAASRTVFGVNRFFINNTNAPVSSTGNSIVVRADLDQPIYAFSVHLTYDAAKIRVTAVQNGAGITALAPEYSDGTITVSPGRIVHGVVFDLSNPITKNLATGTNREMLTITYDVLSAGATTVLLDLNNQTGNPSRLNVFVDSDGDSIAPPPSLVDGTITILPPAVPVIQSITPSTGTAGTEILIVGTNFNQAGLAVTVCGQAIAHTLLGDNQTIRVSAPACATGPADVRVCTNNGCDTDVGGFTYEPGPQPPTIDSLVDNSGTAGKEFLVTGRNFDTGGLSVMVCGVNATFTNLGGGTLRVTAPSCGSLGFAPLKVTTSVGSATEPQGFEYTGGGGPVFIRGDSNNDKKVDLSDAVWTLNYLFTGGQAPRCLEAADANDAGSVDLSDPIYELNFLFQGGPAPPAPFPTAGTDPTPDVLPGCDL